jgi:hypothetical protein
MDSRLGPVISEAYALALFENHYFSWLYQYKIEHPNNTLVTEYDHGGDDANNQQEKEIGALGAGEYYCHQHRKQGE